MELTGSHKSTDERVTLSKPKVYKSETKSEGFAVSICWYETESEGFVVSVC